MRAFMEIDVKVLCISHYLSFEATMMSASTNIVNAAGPIWGG